jgi:hypothetical protein
VTFDELLLEAAAALLLAINGQGDVMGAHSRYITDIPPILSPCLLHGAAVCKQVI